MIPRTVPLDQVSNHELVCVLLSILDRVYRTNDEGAKKKVRDFVGAMMEQGLATSQILREQAAAITRMAAERSPELFTR